MAPKPIHRLVENLKKQSLQIALEERLHLLLLRPHEHSIEHNRYAENSTSSSVAGMCQFSPARCSHPPRKRVPELEERWDCEGLERSHRHHSGVSVLVVPEEAALG